MANTTVKLVKNRTKKLFGIVKSIAGDNSVYVGVPKDETVRLDEDAVNNATLAYIHDNGAPAANIPARPFMRLGIVSVQDKIAAQLKTGAQRALQGQESEVQRAFTRAGLIGQNAVRAKINEGPPPPLKESTIAARQSKGKKRTKPLIDTGQMRNSIVYVVEKK